LERLQKKNATTKGHMPPAKKRSKEKKVPRESEKDGVKTELGGGGGGLSTQKSAVPDEKMKKERGGEDLSRLQQNNGWYDNRDSGKRFALGVPKRGQSGNVGKKGLWVAKGRSHHVEREKP